MMSMSSFAVRMIDADYVLAADEDWTNDGTVVLRNSPRIDLDGHTLTIAGVSAFSITNKTGIVEGYSDLEFLDVSGDQRVETDFTPLDSDIVEMGVMFPSGSAATQMLWCDRTGSSANTFTGLRYKGKLRFDRGNMTTGTSYPTEDGTNYVVVADYGTGECTVNGESAGTMADLAPFDPPTNIVLFASFAIKNGSMGTWLNYAQLRFYYFKVTRGGTPVAHFVPALRQSDNVVGVYDRIAGKFYTNTNVSGLQFTAGERAEITNSATGDPAELRINVPYQELEYIEATGAEYVLTDYTPASTDRVEMKFNFSATDATQCLFCTRKRKSLDSFTTFIITKTGVSGRFFRLDYNTDQGYADENVTVNTDYEVVADGGAGTLSVNGTQVATVSPASFTPPYPFALFASTLDTGTTNNYAKGRCYYFRVYDSAGSLKCDMVPARRFDGAYGMYDRRRGQFYPSASETAFTAHGAATGAGFRNDTVVFSGNLKVVKKGAGSYVAALPGQTYTGGTMIEGGLVVCDQAGDVNPFGADSSAITIASNGVFDLNGKLNLNNYAFVLAGGMITNAVNRGAASYSRNCIADLALTADSSIVLGGKYALTQQTDDVWSARLDLAGNKLTIATPSGFYFRGVEAVSPGTIELHGPRVIQFPGTDSDLRKVDIRVVDGGQLRINNGVVVKLGGYVSGADAMDNDASYDGKLEIYGTFKPDTDYFRGCELQTGATIDVSGRTTPMPLQSLIGEKCLPAAKTVTFADRATVRIDLGARTLASGEPILSWTSDTAPANLATLYFVNAADGTYFAKLADGIYTQRGLFISFR